MELGRLGDREKPVVKLDSNKAYNLAELIDIAERSHPETRAAWERARAAAAAVGLSESAYYPYLAASAVAGYERAFVPFPSLEVGKSAVVIHGGGTLTTEAAAEGAALNLKWLLFDFGERSAARTAAEEKLMAANVSFNGVHEKIVFQVTQRFYEFDTARHKLAAANSALEAAATVQASVEARLTNGLATKPEVLQAEQQAAEAAFAVEANEGEVSGARAALVESLGILPTVEFQVAEMADHHVPNEPETSLNELIGRALSQRPDLLAQLAEVRAAQARVKGARAAYFPKISLAANAGVSELDVSIKNSSYFGGNQPVYGAGLAIGLPIFDGWERTRKLQISEAELRAAENELAGSRDAAVREVWIAYTDFRTALRKQEPAAKLQLAAQSAFDASLEAYRLGLGTYVTVANAQHNLSAARTVMVDTRAAIFTSQAALALSLGDFAKPRLGTSSLQRP